MQIDIEEYYKKYGAMVLRRCRSLLKNEDAAMDAMQDVFVKLLLYKDKLKGQYPSSLLFRIATNVCLNIIRSQRIQECGNDDLLLEIASYDETEDKIFITDYLDRIFNNEPESTRTIAVMYYIDEMTHDEISREVGLSVSGVRKRLRTLKERVQVMEVQR